MKWSKLKKAIFALIAPNCAKRIDMYATSYRGSHDEVGEIWITVDKQKVLTAGYFYWYKHSSKYIDGLAEFPYLKDESEFILPTCDNKLVQKMQNEGIHSDSHVLGSLKNYLRTRFEDSLKATNPIFRAFSLIDRRLGKRRFNEIKIGDDEHKLVKAFYQLRRSILKTNK